MIRKFIIAFICVILSGCIGPKYISHTQGIDLRIPKGASVEYDNEILKGDKYNFVHLDIYRSWFDKSVIIRKDGFEDYHLELNSEWTNEKWAMDRGVEKKQLPATELLTFSNTRKEGKEVVSLMPLTLLYAPILIPCFITDVFNIVVGTPSVAIVNPWKKYKYNADISDYILTPTQEFKKICHQRENVFIGDNECLSCQIGKNVLSTQGECNRCSNREWSNFECRLK